MGSLEGRQKGSGGRKDLDVAEREREKGELLGSCVRAGLSSIFWPTFNRRSTPPLDSNRRGEAIGFGPL